MNHHPDFHVVWLKYKIKDSVNVSWNVPEPLIHETSLVKFTLELKELLCELKVHCSTETEAMGIVEPIIRNWELVSDLKGNVGDFRLEFIKSEIIDRNPRLPGSVFIVATSGMAIVTGFDAVLCLTKCKYPDPPTSFSITPDVESLWMRYKGYLDGKEPLLAMAYYCFTNIKSICGSIEAVSIKYNIDKKVLKKLSELSSVKGDTQSARKHYGNNMVPLSDSEKEWINKVIREIILRIGDTRPISSLKKIIMSDFVKI